tara:strand:+ start:500 stop:919 length:420 start_codon:yes stop_codon:yes gene_type:complete
MTKNDEILIIHTSWYKDFINEMSDTALEILESTNLKIKLHKAPGSLEIPALAKAKISSKTLGILAIGIIIRGETSHYDLVSTETFRSLGQLALDYPDVSLINGVLCVDNKDQLERRYISTTTNNANALLALINEKSCKT